jgi:formylglycine-generating enzyme required for sulfatase activity/serine/threonine protein kinase
VKPDDAALHRGREAEGSSPSSRAETLLAAFLERQEAGDPVDFDALCAENREHEGELRRLHGTWQELCAVLERLRLGSASAAGAAPEPGASTVSGFAAEVFRRLALRKDSFERYRIEGEVAKGGMGAVLRVWDGELQRPLAMKVMLGQVNPRERGDTPAIDARKLGRFLEEARVTGQLDHPGILPVHELGLDSQGRVYFTMKLVKGRDLKAIFDLVFERKEGWNETRALEVILKVCDALAYAHSKGVIHRDLKPANVMVGSFGEVYVMDWGLARVLARSDAHDIRLRQDASSSDGGERIASPAEPEGSEIVTRDGDVIGTPAYMPPEQARGEIESISPRSDVYAVGAMLYHLLARQMPYASPRERPSGRAVLARVVAGVPRPLHEVDPRAPAELVAICERAMEREPERRYPDTSALADDLRAYLEGRVVSAYEGGPIPELRKWMSRNTALAAACTAAVAVLAIGLVVSASLWVKARRESTIATQKANDVLSLSAIQELEELAQEADALWPVRAEKVAAYDAWLEKAKLLIEGRAADPGRNLEAHLGLADHEARLAQIRSRARPLGPEPIEVDRRAAPSSAELERAGIERRTFEFDDAGDRWWHAQLTGLVADLKAFTDERTGLFSHGTAEGHGWGIQRRRSEAVTLDERSTSGPDARARWDRAIAAIGRSERYAGLQLPPQLGILPIGEDPASHLWEFAHLLTGEPATRGADGRLEVGEETGVVLVLVPGGAFRMGAQSTDPTEPNYDHWAAQDENPVHELVLDPYFLSKYEMTQGQWMRLVGRNPSAYSEKTWLRGYHRDGKGWSSLHPVENVEWSECAQVLARVDLVLPTEAQWELAARAGSESPWWTGSDPLSLAESANVADRYGRQQGGERWPAWEEGLDDGSSVHAEVGSYRPNPFGLHDVAGNVWEWCRDGYDAWNYRRPARAGDGERDVVSVRGRVIRGGSFQDLPSQSRSASRFAATPGFRNPSIGLRPGRVVTGR